MDKHEEPNHLLEIAETCKRLYRCAPVKDPFRYTLSPFASKSTKLTSATTEAAAPLLVFACQPHSQCGGHGDRLNGMVASLSSSRHQSTFCPQKGRTTKKKNRQAERQANSKQKQQEPAEPTQTLESQVFQPGQSLKLLNMCSRPGRLPMMTTIGPTIITLHHVIFQN